MVLGPVESAALKQLPGIVRWLPSLWRWSSQRVSGDHLAITGAKAVHHVTHGRFWLYVAVAPSRAPKWLSGPEFVQRARDLAKLALPEPFEARSSEGERAVFVVPHPDTPSCALHVLEVHRSGLIDLQWGLNMEIESRVATLPVDEVVAALDRMIAVARHDAFRGLHKPRWGERLRRLDWRVGLAPAISDSEGQIPWSRIATNGRQPDDRADNYFAPCPANGYAHDAMRSVKPSVRPGKMIEPVLQDILVSAGFVGIDHCVADAMMAVGPAAPAAIDGSKGAEQGPG